jgi:molecular chaperone GrpE
MPSSPASEGGDRGVDVAADEQREERFAARGGETGAAGEERDLAAELARMEDRFKRALADLDNYRKRSAREIDARLAESRDALLRDWLEPLDSVERAIRMQPDSPLTGGLRGVLEQMEAVLTRHGVRRIGERGERFDPERHEAVAVQPSSEVPDHTVLEVARSGFALGDRVLRPAQVVVSRREEAPQA